MIGWEGTCIPGAAEGIAGTPRVRRPHGAYQSIRGESGSAQAAPMALEAIGTLTTQPLFLDPFGDLR